MNQVQRSHFPNQIWVMFHNQLCANLMRLPPGHILDNIRIWFKCIDWDDTDGGVVVVTYFEIIHLPFLKDFPRIVFSLRRHYFVEVDQLPIKPSAGRVADANPFQSSLQNNAAYLLLDINSGHFYYAAIVSCEHLVRVPHPTRSVLACWMELTDWLREGGTYYRIYKCLL